MNRRSFIQKGCVACMGLMGTGVLLESCSGSLPLFKTISGNNILSIPDNQFTGQNNVLLVRSPGLEHDILLVKRNDTYKALYMKCTHEGVGLTATNKKIICAAHGSIFDLDGNVVKEPALRRLEEFSTEINNKHILIHLK